MVIVIEHLSCCLLVLLATATHHPAAVPWVPGLPEIVHRLTKDLEDRGYRMSRLGGQWQLRCVSSISTGDKRWPGHDRQAYKQAVKQT